MNNATGPGIHAAAAVLWVNHHAQETQLAHLFHLLRRKLLLLVARYHARQQFRLCKFPGGRLHGQLFFCELEIHVLFYV